MPPVELTPILVPNDAVSIVAVLPLPSPNVAIVPLPDLEIVGVIKVGDVANTKFPLPVVPLTAPAKLALVASPRNVLKFAETFNLAGRIEPSRITLFDICVIAIVIIYYFYRSAVKCSVANQSNHNVLAVEVLVVTLAHGPCVPPPR